MIARLIDCLDRAANTAAVLLTAAIIVILSAQIVFRYGLNSSITWSEEVATWCMIWVVFIGSASIMRRWEHVHVPLLVQALPLGWRPPFVVFAKLATLASVVLLTWYGIASFQGRFHVTSQLTGISTGWIKLAVPIGAGLMALFALQAVALDIGRWLRRDFAAFAPDPAAEPQSDAPGS